MTTAGTTLRYIVCYDIADDRRRNRLVSLLSAFGQRVQYSVFQMLLDRMLFDKLVSAIREIIDPCFDRVHLFPLCAACEGKASFLGTAANEDWHTDDIVLVA